MSALAKPTPQTELSILVLQLGDEAEVFRSLMALKAVKHLYPGVKLNFIVRREVSHSVKRVDWITSVIETPDLSPIEGSANNAMTTVALWIDQVVDQNYDILINWTFAKKFSKLAAIATALIPAVIKLGDYYREDASIGSYDAWSMYRHAWIRDYIEQDIHMTDIITTQLLTALQVHVGDPHAEGGVATVTSRYFFKNITASIPMSWATRFKNLKWIAVDPSINHDWIEMVLRRHPDIGMVFLGKPAAEVKNIKGEMRTRVIMLEEKLSTDELIHLFSQIQWLVSGKSHLVDLASLMNVRVFYIPEKNWSVDGPYGNGHVIVENASSQAIYAVWSYFQSEWFHKGTFSLLQHFENLSCSQDLENLSVYRTRIRPSQEGGGVLYQRVLPEAYSFESWMARVRGQMARAWFCGWLPPIESEVQSMQLSPQLVKRVRELNESIRVVEKLTHEGKATATSLFNNTENMRAMNVMSVEDRTHVEECGKKLLEIEALIERVTGVEPELKCLLNFYRVLMHNLNGTSLAQMAKESIRAFELLEEGIEIIAAYSNKTLDRAKPKAVAQSVVHELPTKP